MHKFISTFNNGQAVLSFNILIMWLHYQHGSNCATQEVRNNYYPLLRAVELPGVERWLRVAFHSINDVNYYCHFEVTMALPLYSAAFVLISLSKSHQRHSQVVCVCVLIYIHGIYIYKTTNRMGVLSALCFWPFVLVLCLCRLLHTKTAILMEGFRLTQVKESVLSALHLIWVALVWLTFLPNRYPIDNYGSNYRK